MGKPTFREASDAIGLTAQELADLFGVAPQTIRQARLDPDATGYRAPPPGWESVLAQEARNKGGEMEELAEALEAAGEG